MSRSAGPATQRARGFRECHNASTESSARAVSSRWERVWSVYETAGIRTVERSKQSARD